MENPINAEASQELALVLRTALVALLGDGVSAISGICGALEHAVDAYDATWHERRAQEKWLAAGFRAWGHFSGDVNYPVPAALGRVYSSATERREDARRAFIDEPFSRFYSEDTLYGQARRALVNHLIDRIDAGIIPEVYA
jgi:hypothetical protein